MSIIENEAAQAWKRLRTDLDELNSNGTEPPVYRAALTLPLTQGGITAIVGAITEYPSGFTFYLKNTGGAGEIFLICAIDGSWHVWQETDGFIPIISPAVAGNLVELTAGGALVDAGFAVGATGQSLVTSATVDGARGVLGLGAVTLPPRRLNHTMLTMTATNTGSGTGTSTVNGMLNLQSGATGTSTTRLTPASNAVMFGRGASSMMWSRRNIFVSTVRIVVANVQGVCRLIFGKQPADAFGLPASGNYIAITIENSNITSGSVCKAGVLTAVGLTTTAANGTTICIIADNGIANFYANSVLIGSTTDAPTANGLSGMSYELQNGATAANYQVFLTPESECN
jgi:hypothetical protein